MSKEAKIGIIVIIAGIFLYYGFNFLKGTDLFSKRFQYYVNYPNVSGLNISNPVLYKGLRIGRISDFAIQQDRGLITVTLDISQDIFIDKEATAHLTNDGLFGGKAIILKPGNSTQMLALGDTLKAHVDRGMLSQFEPVADNLNTTIIKINTLLDKLNEINLNTSFERVNDAILAAHRKINNINTEELAETINLTIKSFRARSEQLDTLLNNANSAILKIETLEIQETLTNFNTTISGINTLIQTLQSEDGTIGQLMTTDSLHQNLNKLLVDLDQLVIHFNNYPRDFLKPLGRRKDQLKGIPMITEDKR